MASGKDHALVVFGGGPDCQALAADFAKVSKELMGLQPTCLSAMNLREVMKAIGGPLVWGRDDLGVPRETVYKRNDQPFYHILSSNMKDAITQWLKDTAANTKKGNRIIIVLIAHGASDGRILLLLPPPQGMEFLSRQEVEQALAQLSPGTCLLIVNEACYAGGWADLAQKLSQNDVLVEAACPAQELSYNHRSASGELHCLYFRNAFISNLTTYPSGKINEHRNRIIREMSKTNGQVPASAFPIIITSSPSLESSSLTKWIANSQSQAHPAPAPVPPPAPKQSRMRKMWRRIWNLFPSKGSTNKVDIEFLQGYLQDAATPQRAAETPTAGFLNICNKVIDGRSDLKDYAMEVIHWQKCQMKMIEHLLDHLVAESWLRTYIEPETARKFIQGMTSDQDVQIFHTTHARLSDIPSVRALFQSPNPKFIIVFQGGVNWLIDNVTMNQDADLDQIACVIHSFLENYQS